MDPVVRLSSSIILLFTLVSCSPSRPQFTPGTEIPTAREITVQEEEQGHEILGALTEQYPLSEDDAAIMRIRTIVDRLTSAIGLGAQPWHVYLLQADDVVNAGATFGNHLFVWSGLLKTLENDTELTTILAHEIGHILANHPSPTAAELAGESVAGVAGIAAREVLLQQGSIGILAGLAQVLVEESLKAALVNPTVQGEELEADVIGMHLMAEAGYDPSLAVSFWERIQNDPNFSGGPVPLLSTHPSSTVRLENLRAQLPSAMERFRGAPAAVIATSNDGFGGSPNTISREGSGFEYWTVMEDSVHVRSDPSEAGSITGYLKNGDRVRIEARYGRWFKISEPQVGFVRGAALSP